MHIFSSLFCSISPTYFSIVTFFVSCYCLPPCSSCTYISPHLGQLATRGSGKVQRQGLEENCRVLLPGRISRQGSVPPTLANDLQAQIDQRSMDPGGKRTGLFLCFVSPLFLLFLYTLSPSCVHAQSCLVLAYSCHCPRWYLRLLPPSITLSISDSHGFVCRLTR